MRVYSREMIGVFVHIKSYEGHMVLAMDTSKIGEDMSREAQLQVFSFITDKSKGKNEE